MILARIRHLTSPCMFTLFLNLFSLHRLKKNACLVLSTQCCCLFFFGFFFNFDTIDIFTMCPLFYTVCCICWIIYLMLSLSHVVVFLSDTVNMTGLNVESKTLYRNNKNVNLSLDFLCFFYMILAIDTNLSQIKI